MMRTRLLTGEYSLKKASQDSSMGHQYLIIKEKRRIALFKDDMFFAHPSAERF